MKPGSAARPYDPDASAIEAASTQFDEMGLSAFDFDAPGRFDGMGESLRSFLLPSAQSGRTLLLAGAPAAGAQDDYLSQAGSAFADLRRARGETDVPEPERRTDAQDWYFENVVEGLGQRAVDHWTPDVNAMGSTAQVLSTVNTVVGSIPSMVGMPSLFLTNAGVAPAVDLTREGVDAKTAASVGGVNFAVNAIGLKLPAAWGSTLTQRLATGAGSNVALGAGADAASSEILEAGRYEHAAQGFDPANPYARGLDFLMGAAFGWKAHIDAPRLTPGQRDAAMVANNAAHLGEESMPGVPAQPGADLRHQTAMATALNQALMDEPISVANLVRPDDFTLPPRLEAALRAEEMAAGPVVEAVPDPATDYQAYRRALESGGKADARPIDPKTGKPLSSAYGADQFTAATWRRMVATTKPGWAAGLSDAKLLALRADPGKSAEMATALDRQHAAALEASQLPVNRHTLYAAHHFGINKAKSFARAAGNTPMELILTREQLTANPYLRGKTKAEAIANWDERAARSGVETQRPVDYESRTEAIDVLPGIELPRADSVEGAAATSRPAIDDLQSMWFDAPPERASFEEFVAWGEGRRRTIEANHHSRLTEELHQAEESFRDSNARSEANPDDLSIRQESSDAAGRIQQLERSPASPVGKVDLEVIRRAYEEWQATEGARAADGAGDHTISSPGDARLRQVLAQVDAGPNGSELAPGIRARREGDAYRITVEPAAADALQRANIRLPHDRLLSRPELGAAVRAAAKKLESSPPMRAQPTAAVADPLAAARAVAQLDPDLRVPTGAVDADGNPIFQTVGEVLAAGEQGRLDAELDVQAMHAAANCFLRTGQ